MGFRKPRLVSAHQLNEFSTGVGEYTGLAESSDFDVHGPTGKQGPYGQILHEVNECTALAETSDFDVPRRTGK